MLKQVYTWSGDQLVNQQTCYRNSGDVYGEAFSYDNKAQLLSKTDALIGTSEAFTYDRRGNRTSVAYTGPNCATTTTPSSGTNQIDMVKSVAWGSPTDPTACNGIAEAKYEMNYLDRNGRVTDKYTRPGWLYAVWLDYAASGNYQAPPVTTVYKTAMITGGTYRNGIYSYFYDAFARRRIKLTAWSSTDEFFYDLGHQMLSDRGGNSIGSTPTEWPEDDYLWLDGRPIHFIRSRFAPSTMARTEGPGNWCYRNGEAAVCGSFPLITDYLGKPVLTLDRGGISGTGTYQAFGALNRHEARYASLKNTAGGPWTLATLDPKIPSGFDGALRVLLSNSKYGASSSFKLNGVTQPLSGNKEHMWSNFETSTTTFPVTYTSGSASDYGVDLEAYEVRMKETGVTWAWPPMRFPGQYFDAETEFHENWNRMMDPQWGTYLSPDPLLVRPGYQSLMARAGHQTPSYAYAGNNPIKYSDPSGLFKTHNKDQLCPNWDAALRIAQEKAGCTSKPTTCACAAALKCDVCPMLQEGQGPDAFFKNLGVSSRNRWIAGHTTIAVEFPLRVESVEFDLILCNFEGSAFVEGLAATILHEASEHACSEDLQVYMRGHPNPKNEADRQCLPGAI